ncbi:MAG: hypothetical protein JSV77_04855 [Dehalococcoidales bacterium]|nr:MAG: hypothetical protein JSV77_04855 [Dehalococcoidales bacterium]
MKILGFIYHWAGGVIIVAALLIGVLDSISTTKNIVEWVSPFGIQPLHFAFWALSFGAIYTAIVQGIQINRLRSLRPSINVEPKTVGDRAVLEISNLGGSAGFRARGRVIATKPKEELYIMYWEGQGDNCHIDGGGGESSILVAEKAKSALIRDTETSIFEGDLQLFKWGTTKEQVFPVSTYVERTVQRDGEEVIVGSIEEKCKIEVLITATPELQKPFRRTYSIGFDDRRNIVFGEPFGENKGEPIAWEREPRT